MIKKITYFILLFIQGVTYSQNKITHFTVNNGLPHDITYGIFQDKNGFIWIGTDDGLVKYNGQDFKLFSTDDGLRNNFVIDIHQLPNEDIVIATWGGGLHIIRKDKVLPVQVPNDVSEKINNLQIWKNNIVVKHSLGNILYKKNKTGFNKVCLSIKDGFLHEKKITSENDGKGYISIVNGNIFILNDIQSTYHNAPIFNKGLYLVQANNKVVSFSKYLEKKIIHSVSGIGKNKIAVGSQDSIFFFEKNKLFHKIKLHFKTDASIIFKVEKLNNSDYLVVTTNKKGFKEAYVYTNNFTSVIDLKKVVKTDSSVSDILIDHESNIWITTNGDGVYYYDRNARAFHYLNNRKTKESEILDINQSNDNIFILTPNYLTIAKDTIMFNNFKLNGLGRKLTKLNDNSILVNSTIITKNKKENLYHEIAGFNAFYLPNKQNIYVNDSIHIEYLKAKLHTKKRIINDVVYFRDTLWFATNVGMYYYQSNAKDLLKKTIGNQKLLSDNIRKYILYQNALWIATNKGLCQYKDKKIKYYTSNSGLISNQIKTMLLDHNGIFWLGTNRGISIFDGKNFINITNNSGLNSSFVNAIFEDNKNQIWIGTDKGVSIINNNEKLPLQLPPKFHIVQKQSNFTYTIISYNRSKSLLMQYKIDDMPWKSLHQVVGELDFKTEKKGKHKVQFRAKKQDGIWGYSKEYIFEIKVPWYKDLIVITIGISLFSLLVIFLILNQLRKVKQRNLDLKLAINRQQQLEKELEQVRENIAQDFHDDLGNRLARISLLSNLVSIDNSVEDEKVKAKILQIEEDANYLYKGTKDFIFSLKDESNFIEELVTYLSDFGVDFFKDSGIKFKVEKNIDVNEKLPHYWSKQLIYIFKEAFTNVMKHAQATEVVFKFQYQNKELQVSCEDNGKWEIKSEKRGSNGIQNMTKRANKLGGKFEISHTEFGQTLVRFIGNTTFSGS